MSFPSFYYFTFILLFYFYCFILFLYFFPPKGILHWSRQCKNFATRRRNSSSSRLALQSRKAIDWSFAFYFYIFIFFYFKILKILNFNVIIQNFKSEFFELNTHTAPLEPLVVHHQITIPFCQSYKKCHFGKGPCIPTSKSLNIQWKILPLKKLSGHPLETNISMKS